MQEWQALAAQLNVTCHTSRRKGCTWWQRQRGTGWPLRRPYVLGYLPPPGLWFNFLCSKILAGVPDVRKARPTQQETPGAKSVCFKAPLKAIGKLVWDLCSKESCGLIHFIGPKACSELPHPLMLLYFLSQKTADTFDEFSFPHSLCCVKFLRMCTPGNH